MGDRRLDYQGPATLHFTDTPYPVTITLTTPPGDDSPEWTARAESNTIDMAELGRTWGHYVVPRWLLRLPDGRDGVFTCGPYTEHRMQLNGAGLPPTAKPVTPRVLVARAIHRQQPTLPTWDDCLTRADLVLDDLTGAGYHITREAATE